MTAAATFDVDAGDDAPGGRAPAVVCFRYDPDASKPLRPMENVVCERIQHAEGPDPPLARFRYLLDPIAELQGYPTRFERLWPCDATGQGIVRPDDRIVVATWTPSGRRVILFDGFAQIPQVDLGPSVQAVGFTAVGVASRCFDRPIGRRLQRDADDPDAGDVVLVDLPVRFNPDGEPNRTPDGQEVTDGRAGEDHHAFLDPSIVREPDPRAYWTLADVARYVLAVHGEGPGGGDDVAFPPFADLGDVLDSRRSRTDGGAGPVDPAKPGTFDAGPIVVRDYDATGKPWPVALAELLSYAGFAMRWATYTDEDELPDTRLEIYRLDATGDPPRPLDLDRPGRDFRPSRSTVESLSLARDLNAVVNAFTLDVPPRSVEASFVLAPGFTPTAGDESAAVRGKFLAANLDAPTVSRATREAYRLYVLDEAGDGHWDGTAIAVGSPPDLAPIFPPDADGGRTFVSRRRAPHAHILSVDSTGERRRAQLALSRDYAGPSPAVWDGTGTWQPIQGGWTLLDDRVGIYVDCDDPEAWFIGESTPAPGKTAQEKTTTLRGITSQAAPAVPNTKFTLRLTTFVDADRSPVWSAAKRAASPTRFERRRRIDARDVFRRETVAKSSAFADAGADDVDVRDDEADALTHASQLREAHERPPLVGSASLPFLDLGHRVGDRVDRIRGREASLRTGAAAGGAEPPALPRVVAVTWTFADGIHTEIRFTDRPGDVQGA